MTIKARVLPRWVLPLLAVWACSDPQGEDVGDAAEADPGWDADWETDSGIGTDAGDDSEGDQTGSEAATDDGEESDSTSDGTGSTDDPETDDGSTDGGGNESTDTGDASSEGTESGDEETEDGGSDDGGPDDCERLQATIRDFLDSHPDFERYTGDVATTGLVQGMLGSDRTPVFREGSGQITDASTFADWYHDRPGVNQVIMIDLLLAPQGNDVYVYDSGAFFPIDGRGHGNQGRDHNFHFTTEIHTSFRYEGGETFTFRGDDDLWIFVNDRLALDLGGLHPPLEGTIDFDARAGELGLLVGEAYTFDVFHAERHTDQSNFRIETSIRCFEPPN